MFNRGYEYEIFCYTFSIFKLKTFTVLKIFQLIIEVNVKKKNNTVYIALLYSVL